MATTRTTQYERRPFVEAAGDLLRAQQNDAMGKLIWAPLFKKVPNYTYSALLKMVNPTGKLKLTKDAIEAMAAELGVAPDYFLEYRTLRVEERLSESPDLVDAAYHWVLDKEAESAPAHGPNDASGGDE